MNTLAVGTETRDLELDLSGNMKVLTGPGAIAQDVASALKLFAGELWYDTTRGLPYYSQVLGKNFNRPLLQGLMDQAALSMPGVVKAQTTLQPPVNRELHGSVEVIDTTGVTLNVNF